MKRKALLRIAVLFCLALAIVLSSCTKMDSGIPQLSLEESLAIIETNVINGLYYQQPCSKEITNTVFVDKLNEIKQVSDQQIWQTKVSELSSYDMSIHKFTKNGSKGMEATVSNEESSILSSLLRALRSDTHNRQTEVINYYIEEIRCSKINPAILTKCINEMIFLKDIMIYFNFDGTDLARGNQDLKGASTILHKKWDCLYRDCFDCCMNGKLEALKKNNFVEWVKTILSFPENIVWMEGACGWDCIFHK